MAKTIFNFDADAYLKARPDVAGNQMYGSDPYQHYMDFGRNEGMDQKVNNLFGKVPVASDPGQYEEYKYTPTNAWGQEEQTGYKDPSTGNIYKFLGDPEQRNSGNYLGNQKDYYQLVASGDALGDEYISGLGLPLEESEALYQKSLSDPKGYTKDLMNRYSDIWYNNYGMNENQRNIGYVDPILNRLKEQDPTSYYENQIKNFGRQIGWQQGQNTGERIPAIQEQLKAILPDAIKAGLSQEQVYEMLNTGANQGNTQNQQRIANLAASGGSGFNFQKDLLPGLIFVGGAAAGMYGIDQAMMAYQAAQLAGAGAGAGAGGFGLNPAAAGTFGSLNPASTATFGSLNTALTPGTMLGTGLNGGAIGSTYLAAGPGQIAVNSLGAPLLYNGAGDYASLLKNVASGGKDVYDNVNKAKKLGEMLQQATGKGSATGGAGGGGGSGGNATAAILNSNLSLDQIEKNLKSRYNPFMAQPIETIVDQDKIKRNTNYGLANLLGAENNG